MTTGEAKTNVSELLKWYLEDEPLSEHRFKVEAVFKAIDALTQTEHVCENCCYESICLHHNTYGIEYCSSWKAK